MFVQFIKIPYVPKCLWDNGLEWTFPNILSQFLKLSLDKNKNWKKKPHKNKALIIYVSFYILSYWRVKGEGLCTMENTTLIRLEQKIWMLIY